MFRRNYVTRICFLLLVASFGVLRGPSQAASQQHTLTLPADKNSIVRFFYTPPINNYYHAPLLFRVVAESDSRWNTAPALEAGRTAYISLSEMQNLIAALAAGHLSWTESKTVEEPETFTKVHGHGGGMEAKVFSAEGTGYAKIVPDKICDTLAALDTTLRAPRALWELQFFRMQYQCRVPNFDPDAYQAVRP